MVLEVVDVHGRAKFYQTECIGSLIIVVTKRQRKIWATTPKQ